MAAVRRLTKEFKDILSGGFDVEMVEENTYHWQLAFHGPGNTPYFGGTFILDIIFPENYPFEAPSVHFLTKIYHPNVDHKGNICLAILKDEWSAMITTSKILDVIMSLLVHPNTGNPLFAEAAHLYVENIREYNEKAAEVTRRYAMN